MSLRVPLVVDLHLHHTNVSINILKQISSQLHTLHTLTNTTHTQFTWSSGNYSRSLDSATQELTFMSHGLDFLSERSTMWTRQRIIILMLQTSDLHVSLRPFTVPGSRMWGGQGRPRALYVEQESHGLQLLKGMVQEVRPGHRSRGGSCASCSRALCAPCPGERTPCHGGGRVQTGGPNSTGSDEEEEH